MLQALLSFVSYLSTAAALLAAFVWVYEKLTPYREFELLEQNNSAVAIALGGAMLGFTFPMVSSIYYTQSLGEMVLWAIVTGVVQCTVFAVKRRWAQQIEQGQVAPAVFVASGSVAIGLLNAACISH